jgi:hypothetical protein
MENKSKKQNNNIKYRNESFNPIEAISKSYNKINPEYNVYKTVKSSVSAGLIMAQIIAGGHTVGNLQITKQNPESIKDKYLISQQEAIKKERKNSAFITMNKAISRNSAPPRKKTSQSELMKNLIRDKKNQSINKKNIVRPGVNEKLLKDVSKSNISNATKYELDSKKKKSIKR